MDKLISSLMGAEDAAPLTDHAYYKLRAAIVRCEFEPGVRLKVELLSRKYGFSSSPLREALNRLAHEGLVLALDHRGFRVAPIALGALHELTHMRLLLETDALASAIEHGDDEWESRVVAAFHRLSLVEQRLSPEGPLALNDDWSDRHKNFHLALFSGGKSAVLLRTTEMFFVQAERYRRFSALHRRTPRFKAAEHQALMHAALARKKREALALLRAHIGKTTENIAAALARMKLPDYEAACA